MRNNLADMPFFVEVARHKSFTQAAEVLDIPIATLSRRIAAMEKDLGVRLFRRTTRSVDLTEEGHAYYKRCDFIVSEAKNAREALLSEQRTSAGRIRIAMPPTTYFLYLRGALSAFAGQYPEIEFHIHLISRKIDLLAEPYDLELRLGPLPDSSMKVRKLSSLHPVVYAAPSLLERHPKPETPQDLQGIPFVHLELGANIPLLLSNKGASETVAVTAPKHVVNNPGVSLEFILAGQAIGVLPAAVAAPHEAAGRLVRLLPEWHSKGADVCLIIPPGSIPYRVRLFIDFLAEKFTV
ncbi:MAG: HTH-type transcriptional regulator DmlR [Desulfovibrio sp.]